MEVFTYLDDMRESVTLIAEALNKGVMSSAEVAELCNDSRLSKISEKELLARFERLKIRLDTIHRA